MLVEEGVPMRARKERRAALETLRAVPLFTGCSDDELDAIDRLMTQVSVAENEEIIREGALGFEFVIIAEGRVRVTRVGEALAEYGPGGFIGELALLDSKPRSATVTALTPVRAFVLNRAEFSDLLDGSRALKQKIQRAAEERRA
jgi:CRP-like cAMP-binding protein